MKNILLITIVFVFIACNSYAQQKVDTQLGELKYSAADSIVSDFKNNTVRLFGKADFKYGNVHFVADEIFINKRTQKVIATGVIALSVPKVIGNVYSSHKILTYTMGENAVFMQ